MSDHDKGSRVRMRVPDFEVPAGDIFKNDRLDRRPQIESLTRRLMSIQGPCVVALDAPWGDGKTAFVKMWARYLHDKGCRVAEVNAWDTDDSDDPLMALHTELESALGYRRQASGKKKAGKVSFALVRLVASLIPQGSNVIKAVEVTQKALQTAGQEHLDRHKAYLQARQDFKEALKDAAAGLKHPLVVCVDELDRCRPDYAIRFLEAVKHLFDVEGVIFVLAVNLSELAHTVRGVYGNGFNADQYLRRFIDWPLSLDSQSNRDTLVDDHLRQMNLSQKVASHDNMTRKFFNMFIGQGSGTTLRDHLQAESSHALLQNRISAITADRSDSDWDRSRFQVLVAGLSIVRSVIPDEYRQFSCAEITDLETLRALNGRTNRPTDWKSAKFDTVPYDSSSTFYVGATFEAMLICWGIYFSDLRKNYPMASSIEGGCESSALWQYYKQIMREHTSQDGSDEVSSLYQGYPKQVFTACKWFDEGVFSIAGGLSGLCKSAWSIMNMLE